MIVESLFALLIYCGLFVGVFLAYIAPEELKIGKKSFEWGMRGALAGIIVLFVSTITQLSLVTAGILTALMIYTFHYITHVNRIYYLCAGLIVLSFHNTNVFFFQSTLAFFSGMCATGITLSEHATATKLKITMKDAATKVLVKYRTFLIVYYVVLAGTWLLYK